MSEPVETLRYWAIVCDGKMIRNRETRLPYLFLNPKTAELNRDRDEERVIEVQITVRS